MKRLVLVVLAVAVMFSLMAIPAMATSSGNYWQNPLTHHNSYYLSGVRASESLIVRLTAGSNSIGRGFSPYIKAATVAYNTNDVQTKVYFLRADCTYRFRLLTPQLTLSQWTGYATMQNSNTAVYSQQVIYPDYYGLTAGNVTGDIIVIEATSQHKLRTKSTDQSIIIENLTSSVSVPASTAAAWIVFGR